MTVSANVFNFYYKPPLFSGYYSLLADLEVHLCDDLNKDTPFGGAHIHVNAHIHTHVHIHVQRKLPTP